MGPFLARLAAVALSLCLAIPRSAAAEDPPPAASSEGSNEDWAAQARRARLVRSLEGAAVAAGWTGVAGATLAGGLYLAETPKEREAMGIRLLGSSVLTSLPVLVLVDSCSGGGGPIGAAGNAFACLTLPVLLPPVVGLSTWGIGEISRASKHPGMAYLGATGGAAVGVAASVVGAIVFADAADDSSVVGWVIGIASVILVNSAAHIGYSLAGGGS